MNANDQITFHVISGAESHFTKQVAVWYQEEWAIPEAKTLALIEDPDKVLVHVVLCINGQPVATGGIHRKVSIFALDPTLETHKHWLALMFVEPAFRGKGIGAMLCAHLTQQAVHLKINKLQLFTHTAESFYRRQNWIVIKHISYLDKRIAVMEKNIGQ